MGLWNRLFGKKSSDAPDAPTAASAPVQNVLPDGRPWHQPLIQQVGICLMESLPETCTAAKLTVSAPADSFPNRLSFEIDAPDHPSPLLPSDALMAAVRQFALESVKHDHLWRKFVANVFQKENGGWGFGAEFEFND